MFRNINDHYVQPMRAFQRDARLFLGATIIYGIIYSGWQLFFNIYMLQSGFTREFLGLVNSLPALTGFLFAIPIGRLSDRIGYRPALMIGLVCSGLAYFGQVTFKQPVVIAVMAAFSGAFTMFIFVSISPLMMKLSDPKNRTLLFSLNYGLQTIAGAVGSLFAGQLPGLFGNLLHVPSTSASAYQAVLLTTILLGATALIPLWLMREPQTLSPVEKVQEELGSESGQGGIRRRLEKFGLTGQTMKLATPNFLIGIGAAILIPYMNVFFKDRFAISDGLLGTLFGLSSLSISLGTIVGPRLSTQWGGKIRTVAFTQLSSVIFMLMIGFVPSLWIAGFAFLMRAALMNMSTPLYSAFCMEQTPKHQQGLASSVLNIAWQIGWSVGPYVSGVVQEQYGFTPLFLATTFLYLVAIGVMWRFFRDAEQVQLASAEVVV